MLEGKARVEFRIASKLEIIHLCLAAVTYLLEDYKEIKLVKKVRGQSHSLTWMRKILEIEFISE